MVSVTVADAPGASPSICVVTGDLELRTTVDGSGVVTAKVRYAGAAEWYRLRGGSCKLVDPQDHAAVHSLLAGVLNRPSG